MVTIYYDKDADLKYLKGKKIAIIGYGSQGMAQSHNLKDSGLDVVVGLRKGGESWNQAKKDGMTVATIEEAAEKADVIQMLIPDELQGKVYQEQIEPYMKKGKVLMFSHGFNIHYGMIKPGKDIDVIMIAPKSPGHLVQADVPGRRGRARRSSRSSRTHRARQGRSAWPTPWASARRRPASSRRPSPKRPRPTCSASR